MGSAVFLRHHKGLWEVLTKTLDSMLRLPGQHADGYRMLIASKPPHCNIVLVSVPSCSLKDTT